MPTSKNINWKVENITLDRNNPFSHPFITAELSTSVFPKTWSPTELAMDLQDHLNNKSVPEIKNVMFNPPATIVLWSDNTKTVVKCQEGDEYDPEKGLAMAIVKKMYGNTGKYCEIFKKWEKERKKREEEFTKRWLKESHNAMKRELDEAWEEMTNNVEHVNCKCEVIEKDATEITDWISVKELMPEEPGDYIVYDKFTDSVYIYEYDSNCAKDNSYWNNYITHWKYAPAAPVTKKGE